MLLLTTIFFIACGKDEIAKNTPQCIIEKIETLKENSICDDPNVSEYLFQAENVYVFDPGTCGADMQAGVYDENCNALGALGGIAGNTIINGVDFSNAEFKRSIWEKE